MILVDSVRSHRLLEVAMPELPWLLVKEQWAGIS